ncbi:MAG: hypothetical protein M0Z75_15075 [Nitrospiraceae bacterium]|nr:hypothetical protein [Nitrospiraceae bacterium]
MVEAAVNGRTDPFMDFLLALSVFALFFLMVFVPTIYQAPKGVLLGAAFSIILFRLSSGRLRLHRSIVFLTLLMAANGLFFMLLGVMRGAPGAVSVGTVYVVWPVVYTVLIAGVTKEGAIDNLFRMLLIASVAAAAYMIIFVLYDPLGLWPGKYFVNIFPKGTYGVSMGGGLDYIEISFLSMPPFLFVVPFILACLMTWPRKSGMPVKRAFLWAVFFIGMLIIIISGKRAYLLILALAPVLTLFLQRFSPARARKAYSGPVRQVAVSGAIMLAVIVGYLHYAYNVQVSGLLNHFSSGFDFKTGGTSPMMREQQYRALMGAWSRRPLFGAGHGAVDWESVRNYKMPWSYELSYLALLFHVGIVGFSIYGIGVLWIIWKAVGIIRSGDRMGLYMLPVLVGMICYLVVNATNPFLEKFDNLWVLFLPLALINYNYLLKGRS